MRSLTLQQINYLINNYSKEYLPLLAQTPAAQRAALVLSLRPYPDYPRVLAIEDAANSTYHALQITGKKRYSKGLDFLASYTFSKSIDDSVSAVGTFCGGSCLPMDAFNFKRERGPSIFDRRHRFVISYGYELPWGPGRTWLHDGLLSAVAGNWKINGITTAQTSLPFDIREDVSPITTAGFAFNRSDIVGTLDLPDSERTRRRFFNTNAAAAPAPFTLGNTGRNILRGPGYVNFDVSLFRDFLVKEAKKLQFRVEAFNLMNTPNLAYSLSSSVVTRINPPTSTFGRLLAAYSMRQIQFAIKYSF